jgi:hypothetical protein
LTNSEVISQSEDLKEHCKSFEDEIWVLDFKALEIAIKALEKAQERKEEIAKLEELCKPVTEYLKSNYDPYATVVITDSHIKLYRGGIGIPVRNYDLL